jgi:hypothetical protein
MERDYYIMRKRMIARAVEPILERHNVPRLWWGLYIWFAEGYYEAVKRMKTMREEELTGKMASYGLDEGILKDIAEVL